MQQFLDAQAPFAPNTSEDIDQSPERHQPLLAADTSDRGASHDDCRPCAFKAVIREQMSGAAAKRPAQESLGLFSPRDRNPTVFVTERDVIRKTLQYAGHITSIERSRITRDQR